VLECDVARLETVARVDEGRDADAAVGEKIEGRRELAAA
jgi:hypothetical protein